MLLLLFQQKISVIAFKVKKFRTIVQGLATALQTGIFERALIDIIYFTG